MAPSSSSPSHSSLLPTSRISTTHYIFILLPKPTLISARGISGGGGGRAGGIVGGGSIGKGVNVPFTKNPEAIAGTVIACVAFVVGSVVAILWRRKRRLAREQEAKIIEMEDTMSYAQRAAMEDALALENQLKVAKKKSRFQ